MATASPLLSEDQFLCSICLQVFTEPVSIPCGHNFCKTCITQYWNSDVLVQCPMCKEPFQRRPGLRVNTFISEMTAQFRQVRQQRVVSSSGEEQAESGDVPCDVCPGAKLKAVKSCLQCLTSYCETHLDPHHRTAGLKRHKLMEPVRNLEERICQKHERPLEMFCRTDEVCICQFCTEGDHKGHRLITLQEQYKEKKAEVQRIDANVQKRIQERWMKIHELKYDLKLSEVNADRDKDASRQVFTALIRSTETTLAQLIDTIDETQKAKEKQVDCFIKALKEEICQLTKRSSEVKQLSQHEDHFDFLKSFSTLNPEPRLGINFLYGVDTLYEGTVKEAVTTLGKVFAKEVKKLTTYVELEKFRQYAVEVTLDLETAYPQLLVSDDGKQVTYGNVTQNVPDSPKRFSKYSVISQQSFSSGRFYYEVQVKDKTHWTLGVATESINRKSAEGNKNEYWGIGLKEWSYRVDNTGVSISVKSHPQRVGVFVDYRKGQISFYDVDTAARIYSFSGNKFTKKLYPHFNPCHECGGENAAPLIICPVTLQL